MFPVFVPIPLLYPLLLMSIGDIYFPLSGGVSDVVDFVK